MKISHFCRIVVLGILLLVTFALKGQVLNVKKRIDRVELQLKDGNLVLSILDENAVRVQFSVSKINDEPSLILTEKVNQAKFLMHETSSELVLIAEKLSVVIDRASGALRFIDKQGKLLLAEKVLGRELKPSDLHGEPTFIATQKFESPTDEYLFGTGQFQDGYMNIKGLSRRLTQVNTQISIPFVYSNKGYGLLWHNYGLTDFNPADTKIDLLPVSESSEKIIVEVTTTEGTKREVRQLAGFAGTFNVEKSGRYAVLMDVGQKMARKHNVIIDNKEIINFSNYWLPPTASAFVDLNEGVHTVLINGDKNDKPSFYIRSVEDETVMRSPVSDGIDYVVFAGTADEAIASYRRLSGAAPLMPLWSLGYIHCRERFRTQDEILQNTNEFRSRKLPLDLMVQDWQYWGRYGWNAMQFDEKDYPNPARLVDSLHASNTKMMVSVWSKVDPNCEVGKEMTAKNFYIPNTQWIDFFNSDAAACYWKNFSSRLLVPYKIDAWWQDATEPENDDLAGRKVNNGTVSGEKLRNVYPLFVTKTVYEGSRKDVPEKRVCILTRSAFSGEQRYAAATWSGDIGNDWETFRRQIPAGLNYVITGLPYWTTDCGGFFRPSNQYTDSTYHERFLRWFQYATFCPLQRVHGYQTDTEFWRYGAKVEREARRYLNLRYRFLPYIYSQTAAVTFSGSTLMRPLVMDFPHDAQALEQSFEYLFGPSLLVAPVVNANVERWNVYLPQHKPGWYDYWSEKRFEGGQIVNTKAPLELIPLFVKAGSIIPFGTIKQHTTELTNDTIELRVYAGADASFQLYEDDGVSYAYEQGKKSIIEIRWDDAKQTLLIGERKGAYPQMKKNRIFHVVCVGASRNSSAVNKKELGAVFYSGKPIRIKIK